MIPIEPPLIAFREFQKCLPNSTVRRVTIGKYWTLVETEDGAGLVTSPAVHLYLRKESLKPCEIDFTNKPTSQVIQLGISPNPFKRAIGCATINALLNKDTLKLSDENGLDLSPKQHDRVVVVGRFPGLAKKLPSAQVLEKNPGPDDFPEAAAKTLIPECNYLIITASTWVNGSLLEILKLSNGAHVRLIGPGTPLSPILRKYGIHELAGFIVNYPDKLATAIKKGAGVKQFKHLGKFGVMKLPKLS